MRTRRRCDGSPRDGLQAAELAAGRGFAGRASVVYSARVSPSDHPADAAARDRAWAADPRIAALRAALSAAPPAPAPPREMEAAVALLLRPGSDLDVLLIRRARHEKDPWSGHVALPGGRRDPDDADLSVTARRETREEVGLDLDRIGVLLGGLPAVAPASRRLPSLSVTPWVFAVEPGHELTLSPGEVDAAVWVPLDALRDERAAGEMLIEIEGGSHRFPSLTYEDYVVWGLTLRVLHNFLAIVRAAGI